MSRKGSPMRVGRIAHRVRLVPAVGLLLALLPQSAAAAPITQPRLMVCQLSGTSEQEAFPEYGISGLIGIEFNVSIDVSGVCTTATGTFTVAVAASTSRFNQRFGNCAFSQDPSSVGLDLLGTMTRSAPTAAVPIDITLANYPGVAPAVITAVSLVQRGAGIFATQVFLLCHLNTASRAIFDFVMVDPF